MATVNQTITLTVTVASLNIDGTGGGTVALDLSPTAQRGFPLYRVVLTLNTTALKYMRNGVAIWDITPAVLTGPGADSLAAVISDMAAATAAGVFNI